MAVLILPRRSQTKELLKALLVFGVLAFMLTSVFTQQQAIALAMLSILLYLYVIAKTEPTGRLEPFYIRIKPNWYELLTDNKLLDADKWPDLMARIKEDESKYNVLRDGITIVILNPDLAYQHGPGAFLSKIDFTEQIPFLEQTRIIKGTTIPFDHTTYLYMKLVAGGYEFGIVTADGNVKVALLPYSEFWGYHDWGPTLWYSSSKFERDLKKAEKELKVAGWEKEDREPLQAWRNHLKHKYFTIEHAGI